MCRSVNFILDVKVLRLSFFINLNLSIKAVYFIKSFNIKMFKSTQFIHKACIDLYS